MIETETKIQRYESYKESGVEWLGEIPEHWEVLPLFALTKLKSITNNNGLELLSVYLDKGVIRFSDVTAKRTNVTSLDLSKYQLVEPGDFVLNNQQAWRGSVGVSNYNGIVSPAYIVLSLHSNLNPTFANYLFRDGSMVSQYLINSKGVGTIQRNLYWPSLRRSSISLPPLPEQTKIAQFLDDKTTKIDEAIAIKEQQINLLKERKQILIHKAVTRGLNNNVSLKDSGVEWIGEIPEHWEVKRFRYVFNLGKGLTITKDNLREEGVFCVNYGEIHSKYGFELNTNIHKLKCVDEDYLLNNPSALINYGDFVFADTSEDIEGSGNFTYLESKDEIFAGYHTVVAKPKFEIESRFFAYIFESESFRNQIRTKVKGVKVFSITQSILKQPTVWYPSKKEQKEIVDYLDSGTKKIETAISLKQQEIAKLKEYKSSLINSVVTGKVRVC